MQYGFKEVANVYFRDTETKKPIHLFDTLKVSTIENESESAEARGGQGGQKLLTWDYNRTASLTMQDALLSDNALALLSGNEVKKTGIEAFQREVLEVESGSVTLSEKPLGEVTIFAVSGGIMTEELTATFEDTIGTVTGAEDKDEVMAFYKYAVTNENATQVTFSADKFPGIYEVIGDTYSRGRDGKDHREQFYIPQAKLQTAFTLTMDVENVSVFDFNVEVLVEPGTSKLYDITRLS